MANHRRWPYGYYTYIMISPDGEVYYVGAGRRNRGDPRQKWFNGVCFEREWNIKGLRSIVIIIEQENKEDAYNLESKLILQYGRRDLHTGTLYNRTNGLGAHGRILSEDSLERIASSKRGKALTPEHRAKLSESLRGNQNLLGHKHSTETKAKISAAGKGRKMTLSDEERSLRSERVRERNRTNPPRKGKTCSPEHRRKLSESKRLSNARHKG